ncbi:hypothetical protein Holit_00480 [Hollandina sp. SP2]
MIKKIGRLCLALAGAGIVSCTSPLEQMPEKVVITSDPAIHLPLGDPLKGENSLGEELKKALNIDASSIGLSQLYDYTDPEASQDRKFFWYEPIFTQEVELGEYKNALQLGSDDIEGLPTKVELKDELSNLPSLPTRLDIPKEIKLTGTITITNDKIMNIWGMNSGLSLVCKGSKTIPDSIRVESIALNLDSTKTKAKGEVVFGPVMTFIGNAFILTPQDKEITIDIAITMTFTEIVDTHDIGITPGFIFNWTEVELDLEQDIGTGLNGSYPDTQNGDQSIDVSALKQSLFNGKLQFKEIPLYVYVNGPEQWFENDNMSMYLAAATGEDEKIVQDGSTSPVSLPVINLSGQSYAPKTGVASLPSSGSGDLASVFNNYPDDLRFKYDIKVARYIITPAMLTKDALTFEGAIAFILPLDFMVEDEINLAQDMQDFSMPNFGDKDLFGREDAGAGSQVFDFIKGIRLDMEVDNRLGLDGEIKLYSNKNDQEAGKELSEEPLSLQGISYLELTQEKLSETWPFAPAFDIIIPQGKTLTVKRSMSDNPFELKLSIRLDGSITQEISL